jgi:hypothetical protein
MRAPLKHVTNSVSKVGGAKSEDSEPTHNRDTSTVQFVQRGVYKCAQSVVFDIGVRVRRPASTLSAHFASLLESSLFRLCVDCVLCLFVVVVFKHGRFQ